MASSLPGPQDTLADGQIRLLELKLERQHDIVGCLRTVRHESAPAYYALSYVCGNGPHDYEVSVNNALVKVKPNLYIALRRLQSYFRPAVRPVLIWIDAICIDQDNVDEKAKQIRSMHEIFSKADKVLVSLGPVPRDVHMVLSIFSWIGIYKALNPLARSKLLERLEQVQESNQREALVADPDLQQHTGSLKQLKNLTQQLKTRHGVNVRSLLAIEALLERLELSGIWDTTSVIDVQEKLKLAIGVPGIKERLFRPNHPFWAGVYALSEIEWYQRVWTYQEIVLARDARLLAEDLCVDWKFVVGPTVGLLWALQDDTLLREIDSEVPIVNLPEHADREQWRFKWQQVDNRATYGKGLGLISGLIRTRNRNSTIAKDKVYGLLALARSDVSAQIPIDYTTATTDAEVFASAVKEGLREVQPASAVSTLWEVFDEPPSAMEDLPSWCPDFAGMSGVIDPIGHHWLSRVVEKRTSLFACSLDSPGFHTINVKVLKLESVASCMDIACPLNFSRSQFTFPNEREASSTLEAALQHWLLQIQGVFSSDDDDNAPSLGREMTRFLYGTSEHNSLLPIETFRETLHHMLLLPGSSPQESCAYDRLRDWQEYRHTLTILLRQSNRYLLETNSGQIGFSTQQPAPGNHIVLLPGSARAYMLSSDCTRYAGCASLPDVPDDELLNLVNAREGMWEVVELQ